MKLKTLKDFEFQNAFQLALDLKKEAIKWINYLGTTTEEENPEENVAISEWIQKFFNIHPKDLKNGN